jgi:hypothetical protein
VTRCLPVRICHSERSRGINAKRGTVTMRPNTCLNCEGARRESLASSARLRAVWVDPSTRPRDARPAQDDRKGPAPWKGEGAAGRIAARAVSVAAIAIVVLADIAAAQMTGGDWCQSPNPAKSSAVINASGTGETLLVAAVAKQATQVCGFTYDLGGTTPTAEFDYGTQASAACDTSATPMTGAMTSTSRTVEAPLDIFTAPMAKQLCLKLGGTNPTAVGVITYVQK